MTSATPWWGTLVVAGVGFFGILLAQFWTSSRDRRKVAQEQHERAVQARAELYADFQRTQTLFQLEVSKGPGFDVKSSAVKENLERLWRERALIALLAPSAIVASADVVVRLTGDYGNTVQRRGIGNDERHLSFENLQTAVGNLLELMRIDLQAGLAPRAWLFARKRRWRAIQRRLSEPSQPPE